MFWFFMAIVGILVLLLIGWFLYEFYILCKHCCCCCNKYNQEKAQRDEEKFIELDSKFSELSRFRTSSDEKIIKPNRVISSKKNKIYNADVKNKYVQDEQFVENVESENSDHIQVISEETTISSTSYSEDELNEHDDDKESNVDDLGNVHSTTEAFIEQRDDQDQEVLLTDS